MSDELEITKLDRIRADRRTGILREMNDDELIEQALSWALDVLIYRDHMNAAVHVASLRLSPVTKLVQLSWKIAAARVSGTTPEDHDA